MGSLVVGMRRDSLVRLAACLLMNIMELGDKVDIQDCPVADVVNRVRNGESIPYRPIMPETTELGKPLVELVKSCWNEAAEQRPVFQHIRATLRKITGGE